MQLNVGTIDRGARIVLGLALVLWAIGLIPGVQPSIWGWIGVVPLATAFFGYCPLYSLIGVSTCDKQV